MSDAERPELQKHGRWLLLGTMTIGLLAGLNLPQEAHAIGDSSTLFNVYVPANASHTSRRSIFIVTNVSPSAATVDIIDDDADGDNDDSALGVVLARGESYIVKLADGAINDDLGGKADGDYFKVRSDHPVVVQMATHSNWQHDWVPSDGKTSRGSSFFVYAPPTSGANNDINIYAYSDNTVVTIKDVTVASRTATGKTEIDLDSDVLVLDTVLHQGEDLIVRENGLGLDILHPGRTYWIQASKGVTAQYGHLGQIDGGARARDGAGFIPSANGTSSGSLYYFAIPHEIGLAREKELRIACFDDNTTVKLYGTTAESTEWTLISEDQVNAGEHLDFVGNSNAAFRDHDLYKLTVDPPYYKCNAFEGNWMETGRYGTSDFASAVSSRSGRNMGNEFVAYLGPPGYQGGMVNPTGELTNNAAPEGRYASHLHVYAHSNDTNVMVVDVDTNGQLFEHFFTLQKDEYYDVVIDRAAYDAMSEGGYRPYVSVLTSEPVAVMNGNFNDNWMAFFNSSLEPVPETSLTTTELGLSCGDSTVLTVTCGNSTGPNMTDVTATLTLPDGLVRVDGTGAPSAPTVSGNQLQWAAAALSTEEVLTFSVEVALDCSNVACVAPDLSLVTAECNASFEGQVYASLDSVNHTMTGANITQVTEFSVLDVPGYDSEQSRVEVAFTLQGGLPENSSVQLIRATHDPDFDANAVVLLTLDSSYSADAQTYYVQDSYNLHIDQARFYRLVINDGGCANTEGPLAVRTSSGSSSGEDSGLESNGDLASRLARRAIARTKRHTWFSPETVEALDRKSSMRLARFGLEHDSLQTLLPAQGPGASSPTNVTPTDLPALTNADAVFAADYWTPNGERVASALVLETVGEVYDHSKILCDRAKGARLMMLESLETNNAMLMRSALANVEARTGDYATEFKLYELPDGRFAFHAHWLRHDYPQPEVGQRVINVQLWSKRAGYEVAMAHLFLDALDIEWGEPGILPEHFFALAGTLGGTIEVELGHHSESAATLRVSRLLEDGSIAQTSEPLPNDRMYQATFPPFLDATLDIVDAEGKVLDTVWMSDGAWAPLDDGMWGGKSTSTFASEGCLHAHHDDADALKLSGCGRVNAEVADFAGVARHLGGGMDAINPSAFEGVTFWAHSTRALTVCLEGKDTEASTKGVEVQLCTTLAPLPEGRQVTLPMSAFTNPNTCKTQRMDVVTMLTFTAREGGAASLEVGGLALLRQPLSGAEQGMVCQLETPEPAVVVAGPGTKTQAGCSVREVGFGGSSYVYGILVVLGLMVLRRRR